MHRPTISLVTRDMQEVVSSHRSSILGTSDVSWFFWSTDGMWATYWLDCTTTSGCIHMKWSSAGSGTEARRAESPTKIDENRPSCSILGPVSRRQAIVESESLSEICYPVPDANGGVLSEDSGSVRESRGAGTRSCASTVPARWQRGGQRNQLRKRVTARAEVSTGGLWTTAQPIAHAGRTLGVSRWKIGRVVL